MPVMANRKCSKDDCSRPAAGKHQWCLECQAAHKREYTKNREILAHASAFSQGVEAMRFTLAVEFRRLGLAVVSCFEVSDVIRRAPSPRPQQTPEPQAKSAAV